MANSFWVLGITPMIFHFERLSRFPDLVAFLLPYLLAVCFLGQCISHFIKTRESCMMIILFSSLFFLFVSGLSWPWPAVPTFWKVLGVMAPSTLGINGFVRMTNEGATLSQVMPEYIGLWIQVVVYFCLAMFTTKLDIRESCHAFVHSHRRGRHHAAVKDGQNEPETAIATE